MNASARNYHDHSNRLFRSRIQAAILAISVVALSSLLGDEASGSIQLQDVTDRTGVVFEHTNGASGSFHIVETVCAGLALFDYDSDGDVDVYFLNGAFHDDPQNTSAPRNALYRNDGRWQFTDVTRQAGVGDTGFGLGVAVGDYDNDGHPDLYLNNYGPNVMYRNNGDGTFSDVTRQTGLAGDSMMGAGANFLDIEKDGDLDLYVSHYVECLKALDKPATRGGYPAYLGPAIDIYGNTKDTLYRNNGDGTFTDITEASGIGDHTGAGMGTICGDVDNDGDTDIFVCNDMSANFLFLNDGAGRFEEMGLIAGVAYDQHGEEQGSMGAEIGDFDNNGLLDLHVTTYQDQWAALYKNLSEGDFEDVTTQVSASTGTYEKVTWGNGLVDFDNDGDKDLFLACGHLQPNIDLYDRRTSYLQTNRLYENDGKGKFKDVSDKAGDGLKVKLSSRGAGFDDLDNDGDIDVVILNSRHRPTLLENRSPNPGHWLQIRLRGTQTNRAAVGTRVKVTSGDLVQIDEVHSGRGYQSHFGTRLHFGLGHRTKVDLIEVSWMNGQTDQYRDIEVGQSLLLVEGDAKPKRLK